MRGVTEAEERKLVKTAVAHAEDHARDDADFVRLLRERYFAEQMRRSGRTRLAMARRPCGPGDVSRHIYDDPRFQANARALSRRAARGVRILGGSAVRGTRFADCVAVGGEDEWACTGTLVSPTAVVSAGHCAGFATRVFFGNDVSKGGAVVAVKKAMRHPGYHKRGKHNDLLVLVLAERAPATAVPRALAPSAVIDRATDARVVGFGNTDPAGNFGYGIKRQTDVPIASPACAGQVDGEDDEVAYGCDPSLELVAGKPLLARDTCTGDSGGPLYVDDGEGKWLLAGATSRATDSATHNCGDGGVYVRVDRYRAWIEKVGGALS